MSRLDNNTQLYDQPSVIQEINDCITVINLLLGTIQTSVQILTGQVDPAAIPPLTPQLVYQVPAGIIWPVAVAYEGRNLRPMSLRALASQFRSWATDTSSPNGRPVNEFACIGLNQFCIHPRDGLGGRSLVVTGVCEPTPLVQLTDTIPIPNDCVDSLTDLVSSVLPIREGGQVFAAAAAELYSSFITRIKVKSAYTGLVFPSYYERLAGWKPRTPSEARLNVSQ